MEKEQNRGKFPKSSHDNSGWTDLGLSPVSGRISRNEETLMKTLRVLPLLLSTMLTLILA